MEELENDSIKISIHKEKPPRSGFSVNWEKACYFILLALGALLPIWVLPFEGLSLGFSKSLLISFLIIACAIFYLIHTLQKGSINLPKSFLFLVLAGIIIITLISSFFSLNFQFSFFGTGNEIDTFVSIVILSIGLYLFSTIFQSEERIMKFLTYISVSSVLVFLFQLLRSIFGLNLNLFGLFPSKLNSIVGSWPDLGILFGMFILVSVIIYEFFSLKKSHKILILSFIVVSLIMMVFINFTSAWYVLGIFLLVMLVYLYSIYRGVKNFARLPLFMVLVIMFFILSKTLIGDLVNSMGIDYIEVKPSFSATWSVSKDVLGDGFKNAILGSGPNTFKYDWLKFKPVEINQTVFWNTRFLNGVGLIPSFLASLGILGFILWMFFIAVILYYGFRSMSYSGEEKTKGILLITFLATIYLWIFNIIHTPSNFIFALSFIFLGLFLGILVRIERLKLKEINFINNSSVGFISSLLIVLMMIVGVASFYLVFQKYWAAYAYGQGLRAFNEKGDLAKAENDFIRAIRFDNQDRFYNTLSEVGLLKLSQIVNQNMPQDDLRLQFQNTLSDTISYAQNAKKINSTEPNNWLLLGRIYESIVPFGVEGARQFALENYKEALKIDPYNPLPLLSMSRVEIQSKDLASARNFLNSALVLKGDYVPALFLLAQLEAQEGNLQKAIQQTEQAMLISPNDIGILFQLGLLYYQDQKFENARLAFEKTISLSPDYSNARYFLGLIYDKEGRKKDAIEQFKRIKELNPGNTEVENILENLQSGKSALSQISPPAPPPEKRDNPPISEEENKKENR